MNDTYVQKFKIGHRAKFEDEDNFFPQVLFLVRAILRRIFTSGVLFHASFDRNLIHSADACFLVMACVGYARAHLKTLSSLLNKVHLRVQQGSIGAGGSFSSWKLKTRFLSPLLLLS